MAIKNKFRRFPKTSRTALVSTLESLLEFINLEEKSFENTLYVRSLQTPKVKRNRRKRAALYTRARKHINVIIKSITTDGL